MINLYFLDLYVLKISMLLLSLVALFYQETLEISEMKVSSIPTEEKMRILNRGLGYRVYIKNKKILVEKGNRSNFNGKKPPFVVTDPSRYKMNEFPPNVVTLKVSNGWLIGFGYGEWGGSLSWFNNSGKRHYEIPTSHIIDFITDKNKIYSVSSSMIGGTISEISMQAGKWAQSEYLKLPESLFVATMLPNNEFLMVMLDKLIYIKSNKEIITLIDKGFWRIYLGANSIVVNGKDIYVGMQGGVMKTSFSNPQTQVWLAE